MTPKVEDLTCECGLLFIQIINYNGLYNGSLLHHYTDGDHNEILKEKLNHEKIRNSLR